MIWLSVDPGEDTGWALWEDDKLLTAGTDTLWKFLDKLWDNIGPVTVDNEVDPEWFMIQKIVCEDWALYPWKLKQMGWDKCRTARGIGAIELLCRQSHIELELQPASIKEEAQNGGAKELFLRPLHENRHANDAIMHGFFNIQRSRARHMKLRGKAERA